MWTHSGHVRRRRTNKEQPATILEEEEPVSPSADGSGSDGGSGGFPYSSDDDFSFGRHGATEEGISPTSLASSITGKKHAAKSKSSAPMGITLDGQNAFRIPELFSFTTSLLYKWYSLSSIFTWLGMLGSGCLFYYFPHREHLMVLNAIFWRLCCNVGLGLLLNRQSHDSTLTKWIGAIKMRKPASMTWWRRFERSTVGALVKGATTNGEDFDVLGDRSVPAAFSAWVALRSIINIVEVNDVVAFILTVILYGHTSRPNASLIIFGWSFALMLPLCDVLGLTLIGISLYSKLEARRTGGEFAWYWGDFFFLRLGDVELLSNNIFDLFPHPMYTVGYAWTYGCAILARSYAVLALAMAFHLSQLAFLMLVEVPHVEKLYSPRLDDENAKVRYSWPRRVWSLSGIPDFDITSDVDVTLALSITFFLCGVGLGSFRGGPLDDDVFFVLLALFWHVVANLVKTYILVMQDRDKRWTAFFEAINLTVAPTLTLTLTLRHITI